MSTTYKHMSKTNNDCIADVSQRSGLLPCPFCGSMPYKCRNEHGHHIAKCYNCGVEMKQDRADKLKGMWNRREKGN